MGHLWYPYMEEFKAMDIPRGDVLLEADRNLPPCSLKIGPIISEMLRITPTGEIYVQGKLAESDKEIADAVREFARQWAFQST